MSGKYTCAKCHKVRVFNEGDLCSGCSYERLVKHVMNQPSAEQDWSFTHCEECGSSLNSRGQCTNTWCGNSPYQGTDWE
jgi:hypothetical protein